MALGVCQIRAYYVSPFKGIAVVHGFIVFVINIYFCIHVYVCVRACVFSICLVHHYSLYMVLEFSPGLREGLNRVQIKWPSYHHPRLLADKLHILNTKPAALMHAYIAGSESPSGYDARVAFRDGVTASSH